MATTAETVPAPATRTVRTPVSTLRQMLRLTRVEFTLFYRYRMALYIAVLPLVFLFPALSMPEGENAVGVDNGAHYLASVFILTAMTVGIIHIPNVYAARRESMLLKRFRASGVAPVAMFGATTLSVLGVVIALSAVITGVLAAHFGESPHAPVLLLFTTTLSTVLMCLFGLAFTRLARNAESAQIITMAPFLVLLAISGALVPVEMMPDRVADVLSLLPMLPAVDIVRSAYFGLDLFSGPEQATAATGLELWVAAAPSLLVLLAWTGIAAYLVRYFRWDPRQGK